jgi:hypothetical protein
MSENKLRIFREEMSIFFSKLKNKEKKLSTWQCPYCLNENDIPIPVNVVCTGYKEGAKNCYECGKPFFVKVYLDGETDIKNLNQ